MTISEFHKIISSASLDKCMEQRLDTNKNSIEMTVKTKKAHFWSRSKKKLWLKGETSGNKLNIINIYTDCDSDALIYEVELEGIGACHTGKKSCFYKKLEL